MATPQQVLQRLWPLIVQNEGALKEAFVFAFLLELFFVCRAFEFAEVDGGVDCSDRGATARHTYSQRLWDMDEVFRTTFSTVASLQGHSDLRLLLFDVKSRGSGEAEGQVYSTTIRQRHVAAFYIGICGADPNFIEIFPNYYAGLDIAPDEDRNRQVAVNLSRKSIVDSRYYLHLSPCNSPYRMPLSLLAEAMTRMRQCARQRTPYVNPWTGVSFAKWQPPLAATHKNMLPDEDTQHGTGYIGLVDIWRGLRVARNESRCSLKFEFIDIQPRLADFKLVLPNALPESLSRRRQLFVQYKIDSTERARSNRKIAIGRNDPGKGIRWYFNDIERFDFLWYEFRYKDPKTKALVKEFYFIPEAVLPDRFFTSTDLYDELDAVTFDRFHSKMDLGSQWVDAVEKIVITHPNPRKVGSRGCRPTESVTIPEHLPSLKHDELSDEAFWFYDKFFDTIMTQCAARQSGLLIVLAREHPLGDFAYCRYTWTREEQEAYLVRRLPPCSISSLPPVTPVVPIHAFTKVRAGTSRGPILTPAEFHRLNMSTVCRLLFFDMFGQEGRHVFGPLIAVPSDDVSITSAVAASYNDNFLKNNHKEFMDRSPLLSQQIHTGCTLADYTLSTSGPHLYGHAPPLSQWSDVWELLDACTQTTPFEHPPGFSRDPQRLCIPLQHVHQSLVDRHAEIDDRIIQSGGTRTPVP